MTQPFPLQTVLDLMQERADDATLKLARLIANEKDAKNKLAMIQQYRNEYAARFSKAAQQGISQREWHNYQEFLNRLVDAITSQQQTVLRQEQNTVAGQKHWQQQRQNLKAFDTLSDRHYARETERETKQ